ncbi:MAG: plasmid maintenance system killer [Chloroflexi bacterium]|nr:plasmid maintenance system killer [Chloroflexota bacterium]
MRFAFADSKLKKLYTEEKGAHKYPAGVVDAFFDVIAIIANAPDERDLYKLKSLHYEKLRGRRSHQRSLRLNRQFRLIIESAKDKHGRFLWIISIEDYH